MGAHMWCNQLSQRLELFAVKTANEKVMLQEKLVQFRDQNTNFRDICHMCSVRLYPLYISHPHILIGTSLNRLLLMTYKQMTNYRNSICCQYILTIPLYNSLKIMKTQSDGVKNVEKKYHNTPTYSLANSKYSLVSQAYGLTCVRCVKSKQRLHRIIQYVD